MILIPDVLFVPKIDQILSVGQLMEKGYKLSFEDKVSMIRDAKGIDLFKIEMKGRSFSLNFEEEEKEAMHKEENSLMLWHKR